MKHVTFAGVGIVALAQSLSAGVFSYVESGSAQQGDIGLLSVMGELGTASFDEKQSLVQGDVGAGSRALAKTEIIGDNQLGGTAVADLSNDQIFLSTSVLAEVSSLNGTVRSQASVVFEVADQILLDIRAEGSEFFQTQVNIFRGAEVTPLGDDPVFFTEEVFGDLNDTLSIEAGIYTVVVETFVQVVAPTQGSSSIAITVVPTPGTAVLAGLVGVASLRRQRSQCSHA